MSDKPWVVNLTWKEKLFRGEVIRKNASRKWTEAGCPPGRYADFWLQAEEEYDGRLFRQWEDNRPGVGRGSVCPRPVGPPRKFLDAAPARLETASGSPATTSTEESTVAHALNWADVLGKELGYAVLTKGKRLQVLVRPGQKQLRRRAKRHWSVIAVGEASPGENGHAAPPDTLYEEVRQALAGLAGGEAKPSRADKKKKKKERT
jgi:hypothetical protein